MHYKHRRGFLLNLITGLALLTASIGSIMYATLEERHEHHWITWTVISSVIFIAGTLITGNAFVHKVKSDLLRRETQKLRKDTASIVD